MKKGLSEIIFILDASGSMTNLAADTIGSFNSLIEEQKKDPGETYITTVLFNNYHNVLHNHISVKDVEPITQKDYLTFGTTALLDTVGKTIDNIGERLFNTDECERPEKIIFVIITDGLENASKEYSKSKVKEMIEHQQNKYSWTFMFLGANMDAVSEGSSLGIDSNYSKTYTASSIGTETLYRAVSKGISNLKTNNEVVAMNCLNEII